MVNDHSDSEREETHCRHMDYSFRLAARVLLYAPSHRQDITYHGLCYTSCGALAGTRNSYTDPPWRIDPTTHRTMSYISLPLRQKEVNIGGMPHRSIGYEVMLSPNIFKTKFPSFLFFFLRCLVNNDFDSELLGTTPPPPPAPCPFCRAWKSMTN